MAEPTLASDARSAASVAAPAVTLADVEAARERIKGGIYESPCVESIPLSQLTGAHIYCKLDYLQRTGSFKERGARNALLQLPAEQRARGVIAASAGNHAQGVAYHGALLGIPVTVVMPKFASLMKVTNCRHLGATIVLHGADLTEARAEAEAISAREGLTFIHPFDNANVIAGQGTIALEMLACEPSLEAIVVPVGGGGLISGVAAAIKLTKPTVHVFGVEPELAADAQASLRAGKIVSYPADQVTRTIADGLSTQSVGPINFDHMQCFVDGIVTVTEDEIHQAMKLLATNPNTVAEPSGAVATAGFLFRSDQLPKSKLSVAIISGGNIESAILKELRT